MIRNTTEAAATERLDVKRPELWLLVGFALAGAAGVFALSGPFEAGADFGFWLVACLVGELLWVRVPFANMTISMASCFNFAAALVLPMGPAMAAAAGATALGEAFGMRKSPMRWLFNSAQTAIAVGLANLLFHSLQPGDRTLLQSLSSMQLQVFLLPGLMYYAVNRGAVTVAMAVGERTSMWRAWRSCFGHGFEWVSTGGIFSLGALLATHYSDIGMGGTLLVLLPLARAVDGLRRYWSAVEAKAEAELEAPGRARAA